MKKKAAVPMRNAFLPEGQNKLYIIDTDSNKSDTNPARINRTEIMEEGCLLLTVGSKAKRKLIRKKKRIRSSTIPTINNGAAYCILRFSFNSSIFCI
jgi:hypothetical protein